MAASFSYDQIPSSSASPPTGTLWDVFLSFRGEDTRYTFTDHLYHALDRTGIRTFKDDPELRSGEVISDSLIQAITESKTYIVVLSENYASSPWCLDELVEILRSYKKMKRLVVPVYYYIVPYVVKRQIESFKEAFDKHQTRYDAEKVKKWRLTLKEVADFSGYHISKNRSQADIVNKVVERVLLEINPVTLNVAKYPVGLDSRVKGVTALFNSDVEGVIRIGIHGMGGVGKTTLAKAVYNLNYQLFQGSCFLVNVREASRTEKGIVSLQQQLINDVLKCNNIKVASADQGIELIRYRICSKKVLIVVDDLDDPKPLECLQGSFALGSIVIITTRNEDMLDRINVKAKYRVDRMDKAESYKLFTQHAFGDETISGIFLELSNEILMRAGGLPLALQVFGSNLLRESEDGWRKFIDKLKRTPNDDVQKKLMISFDALKSVDDFLQDIFLDIACFYIGWKKKKAAKIMETCYAFVNHNIDILKKRCLITINESGELGMHDLLRDMGREIARSKSPDEPEKHSRLWLPEDIDTVLKNHKGTEAIHGISGNFDYLEKVEGVTFNAKSFKRMGKLKLLYLNNVKLTGSFEQTFEDLRWLRWDDCPLECLPSKFCPQKLVILELPYSKMRTLREQNMVCEKLKTLNMSYSKYLVTAPDFTGLPCLETINLKACHSLEEVHISIGSLVGLVHLDLRFCKKLKSLPDSICNLRSLEILDISYCKKLEELPNQLGMITSLKELILMENTMLRMLPDISQLSNIKDLDLAGCYDLLSISELPTNLGRLKANGVKTLDLSSLKHLKELDLTNCKCLTEIQGLEELTSLKDLNLWGCRCMERLPNLSNLKHLKKLDLTNWRCLTEIQSLEELTSLKDLNLWGCRSMERLPNLSNLKHLKKLDLTNCRCLTEIQSLEELTSLKDLNLWGCRSMERLPNLSNLKHLKKLDLEYCASLTEVIGLEELTSLEDLRFRFCGNLLSISGFPPNQKLIKAEGCTSLKRLTNLSSLKQLKILDLTNCEALKEIQGLEELTSLEDLNLSFCRSLERLPDLSILKHLKKLDLEYCASLTEVTGLEELTSFEDLKFGYCGNLLSFSRFPPNQNWVKAKGCTSLKRLPNLSNLKHLKRLDLTNCEALKEIQGLKDVTSLEYLTLSNRTPLERFPNLCNLKQLRKLDLSNCLRELHLAGCKSSFLARTFTKRFFEILSGFGHRVEISLGRKDFKDTVEFGLGTQLTLGCRMSSDLRPNESQSFLAIILALDFCKDLKYSVMNIKSGFIWSDTLVTFSTPAIVIVPSSIFLIRDGDDRIEITADTDILCGIHLQYKTGITMISEFCSTADNLEDERSNSWQQ